MRMNSAMRHHLRKNAVDGIGMDERDLQSEEAFARLRVDELRALAPQRLQRGADVAHLDRDVVHAFAARIEEPADGRVGLERAQKLDAPVADDQCCGLHALLDDGRTMLDRRAEQTRVRVDCEVEIGDGYAHVMDPAYVHRRDARQTWGPPYPPRVFVSAALLL